LSRAAAGPTLLKVSSAAQILIVEDDDDLREVVSGLLRELGYKVATAVNGSDALAYLRTNRPPGLIVLDVMMPVMDGVEFCRRRLRDPSLRAIPIFLFTARGQSIANVSAVRVLRKPLVVDEFIDAVRSVVAPAASS
jgi:CheY-like chemotaxis protein